MFSPGRERTPENIERFKNTSFVFDGGYNGRGPAEPLETWLDEVVKEKETDYLVEVTVTLRKATEKDRERVDR